VTEATGRHLDRLIVAAWLLLVASLGAVPVGALGFAFQNDLTDPGHGLAGYAMAVLTVTGPALAAGSAYAAHRLHPVTTWFLVVAVLVNYAAWALLLRAIVHYGIH
jgi:hypothetical protein